MILTVFILVGVLAVTVVLFVYWIAVNVFKLICGLIPGIGPRNVNATNHRHCLNPGCRTINPLHASFCRRCGSNLGDAVSGSSTPVSRARYNPNTGNRRQAVSV